MPISDARARNAFKARLAHVIENSGLLKQEIAEGVGVSPSRIGEWLRRGDRIPSALNLAELVRVTGCDGHWLLTGERRR